MENMLSFLSGMDIRYVYLAAAIIGIAAIISIIKKAIKIGIIVLIIAILITYGGTWAANIQKDYHIVRDGDTISATINGQEYSIDFLKVKEIVAQDLGNGKEKLSITETDGGKKQLMQIEVPQFMYSMIKAQAKNMNIKITER